ncbi:MAG: calcium-binding protein, partial [Arenimonas sp.]
MSGNGVNLTGAAGGVLFDLVGNGTPERFSWTSAGSDDAWLALDRNGNGRIDNGTELFGADTIMSNGQRASSGFEALADLDSNHDGIFNSADAQFANVRIWRDLNQDGVSQANELFTLEQAGVVSINLTPTSTTDVNLGNGNLIDNVGTFTRSNGTSGQAGDLQLASNTFFSRFLTAPELQAGEQPDIPNVHGSGMVRDLREAMILSQNLATQVASLSAGMTRDAMRAQLIPLMDLWAGTSSMLTGEQQYESSHAQTNLMYTGGSLSSAELGRIIGVLERFNGSTFVSFTSTGGLPGSTNISSSTVNSGTPQQMTTVTVTLSAAQVSLLMQSYNALLDSLYGGLVAQTRLSPYVDMVTISPAANGTMAWNYSAVSVAILAQAHAGNVTNALFDLYDLQQYGGQLFATWSIDSLVASIGAEAATQGLTTSFNQQLLTLFGTT